LRDFDVRGCVVAGIDRAVIWDTLARPSDMVGVRELVPSLPLTVVYSHGDWDHVWGTKGLGEGWEEVVAHGECAGRFAEELPRTLEEMRNQNAEEFDEVRLVPPTRTFQDQFVIELGPGLSLELHALPGHTPDTIVGFIPEWGVLLAGDAVETPLPFLNPGGNVEEWAGRLEGWATHPRVEVVIPSHGPIGGRNLLEENASYLRALLAGQDPVLPEDLTPFYRRTHAANRGLAQGSG